MIKGSLMLHLGLIWYHLEPSVVPYSQNLPRPISWFGLFLQQNNSSRFIMKRLDELEMLEKVSWKSSNYLVWWRCLPSPLPRRRRGGAARPHGRHQSLLGALLSLSKSILFMIALCGRPLHCACHTKYVLDVEDKSKFGRNQCLYWNKWYLRRKLKYSVVLVIKGQILHRHGAATPSCRKKNTKGIPMLLAGSRRGAL